MRNVLDQVSSLQPLARIKNAIFVNSSLIQKKKKKRFSDIKSRKCLCWRERKDKKKLKSIRNSKLNMINQS